MKKFLIMVFAITITIITLIFQGCIEEINVPKKEEKKIACTIDFNWVENNQYAQVITIYTGNKKIIKNLGTITAQKKPSQIIKYVEETKRVKSDSLYNICPQFIASLTGPDSDPNEHYVFSADRMEYFKSTFNVSQQIKDFFDIPNPGYFSLYSYTAWNFKKTKMDLYILTDFLETHNTLIAYLLIRANINNQDVYKVYINNNLSLENISSAHEFINGPMKDHFEIEDRVYHMPLILAGMYINQ